MIVSETSFQHLEQYGTQRGKEEETREIKGRKKRENCRGRERDGNLLGIRVNAPVDGQFINQEAEILSEQAVVIQ